MIDLEEIDESQVDDLINELSDFVVGRGLATPAVVLLEMNKPLGFVASQSVIVAAPFLAPVFGIDRVGRMSKLLASREHIERLIVAIEKKSNDKSEPCKKE